MFTNYLLLNISRFADRLSATRAELSNEILSTVDK